MGAGCLLCHGSATRPLFLKGGKRFVRCRGCGLVWLEPRPTPAELARYYDASYGDGIYTPFAAAEDIRRLIAEHRMAALRPLARPGRWLDVGCAAGHFVEAARRAGMAAEGCDVSARAVELASARGLTAYHAGVETFTPTAPYDTITAFDVLEHLPDPRAFLDRLRPWLAPEGNLVLTLPNVASIYPRLMRRHWFYYLPSDHLFYWAPPTITRLLGEHGFRVVRVSRTHKPLTIDYIVPQLGLFTPPLAPVANALAALLPRRLRARPWSLYIGEMMVVATATPAHST